MRYKKSILIITISLFILSLNSFSFWLSNGYMGGWRYGGWHRGGTVIYYPSNYYYPYSAAYPVNVYYPYTTSSCVLTPSYYDAYGNWIAPTRVCSTSTQGE